MFASRHEGRRAPITRGAASVLILAFWLAASAAAETLVLDGIERQHDLSPHLSILKDPSKALGIDDVLSPALTGEFQATDGRAPSFGYTDAAFWVKFTLANATSEPLGKVLELAYPTVNELDLYVVNSEGVLRHVDSGMEHPFSARDYSYQNFLFDVDIPAQAEVTVYLRFYSVSSSLIPLVLWDRHALLEHIVTNQYVLGSIAGAFLVLILYEMFIYVSLRDRSHLYYIFFLVFGLLYQMSVKGVAYEMLWPGSYFWGERSLSFFVFATLASVSLFTMELLALKKLLPRAYRAYQVIALAMGTMAVASLIFDYGTFVFLSTVFGGIVSIFLFSCAGYFYRLKIPYSGQYLAGWLLLTVGTTLTVLKFIGALPSTLLTNYGFEFGSVFQIAFFSMALADRINHLKREVIVEEQRRVLSEEKSQELEKQNEIVRQALEQKTATSDVLRVISESQTDVVPVFDTIAERMERLSPGSIVLLTLVRDDAIHLAALAGVDGKDAALLRARFPQPADETTATGRAIGARQPVIIEDVSEVDDYALRDAAKTLGFRGALAVPVVREGHALGAITLLHMRGGAFGAHETDLIRTFADQAAIAIENTRMFEELQEKTLQQARAVEELRSLSSVSQIVNSTLDLQEVLSSIVRNAVKLSGTEGGIAAEADDEEGGFRLQATYGLPEDLVEALRDTPLQLGEDITNRPTEDQTPIQIPDLSAEPQDSRWLQLAEQAGFRSLLAVPLAREGRVLGVLAVARKAPGDLSTEVIELLQTFAAQSTLAIQNARLFREVAQKSQELEIASQHKSQFLANMSHELRTPLNAILGYTELVADGIYGDVSEEIHEVLERVQGSGRNLLSLINDVLDLSKIEAGQLDLVIDDYSFEELVQGVITSVEPLASEKGLEFSSDIATDLPTGRGDERRLAQVVMNLVGNAIKFTDSGSIRIRVTVSGNDFIASVSDTGPGIARDQFEQIFDEFQQVDSSSTRNKAGTGLGLAISRRIVELHGGSIWVESELGHGSTFSVRIPVAVSVG